MSIEFGTPNTSFRLLGESRRDELVLVSDDPMPDAQGIEIEIKVDNLHRQPWRTLQRSRGEIIHEFTASSGQKLVHQAMKTMSDETGSLRCFVIVPPEFVLGFGWRCCLLLWSRRPESNTRGQRVKFPVCGTYLPALPVVAAVPSTAVHLLSVSTTLHVKPRDVSQRFVFRRKRTSRQTTRDRA